MNFAAIKKYRKMWFTLNLNQNNMYYSLNPEWDTLLAHL